MINITVTGYSLSNTFLKNNDCSESIIGLALARIIIIDLIVSPILATVVAYATVWKNKGKKMQFKISSNINDLVYKQTIYWVGVFFCPMLFVIGCISNLILFYIKRWLLFKKFAPPEKIQGIGHKTKLPFFALLFISLCVAAIPLILLAQVQPLPTCGVHNGTGYTTISGSFFYYLQQEAPDIIVYIIDHITNPLVLYGIIVILGLWLYFTNIMAKRLKHDFTDINNQLLLEKREKIALIRKFKLQI